ncbi:glycoside hydrolase family 104 protein [Rhizobium leguminosarum]|nr:glycoside hydrolase family 104 protein [Rhizobium leguminosarum]MBY5863065.1 glycoside hydrolase family 104 protein [Rhizobium leguminosarum]
MSIYRTNRPFVKLYAASNATDAAEVLGIGFSRFVGDGTTQGGRLKVTREGETQPIWWIDEDNLTVLTAEEVKVELPPIVDVEFYEDTTLAARLLSGFLDAGGMNAEYLLLLAWAESGWTNTDDHGRDGSDADLDGPLGPYRFAKDVWSSLVNDKAYQPVLRGFNEFDRIKPQAQCFFAAALANRLQGALRSSNKSFDPPAWLLRLGHRIGSDAAVRFAQLADTDVVATQVSGLRAVSAATVNANPKLFPNKSDTTKLKVIEAIRAEFESGKRAVVKRLADLAQLSAIDGMIEGSSPGMRPGALGLLDFIGKYEAAGGNYNAVVDRGKNENNPRLVAMTIAQIQAYQASLGKRNACGKYQITATTLQNSFRKAGLSEGDLFDPDSQDKIGYYLLMTRRGGEVFLKSDRSQDKYEAFALQVAQEWAAMPVLEAMVNINGVQLARGDSYYTGTAGNQTSLPADTFEAALRKFIAEA